MVQSNQIYPNRPEPISPTGETPAVHRKSDKRSAAEQLCSGELMLVNDRYSTGMAVLAELKKAIFQGRKKSDFTAYRQKRSEFHHASNRLLVPVRDNKIALKKSPEPGWLERLYPDISDFYITFPQFQGLNSSWQWYLNGIRYPGLREKIHPFYGTYFPTRVDHLRMFYRWLQKYEGRKKSAIDMGTGCGVLAFQMLNCGFESVMATDINPNAILSVQEHAKKCGYINKLNLKQDDLFEPVDHSADLIVFNPPWLPAQKEIEGLDSAIYYEHGLFENFFDQAFQHMNESGRLVILFSNLAETTGTAEHHPVKRELNHHHRYKKVNLIRQKVKPSSKKTKRRENRKREFVELWELMAN